MGTTNVANFILARLFSLKCEMISKTIFILKEKALKTEIEDSMFREVWLHEGCAVWTPNLFFIQNRLKGIWSVLESSSKLVRLYKWLFISLYLDPISTFNLIFRNVCHVRKVEQLSCVTSTNVKKFFTFPVPSKTVNKLNNFYYK